MRTLPLVAAGTCLAAVVAGAPSGALPPSPGALPPSPGALPMTVAAVTVPSSLTQFSVYDDAGTLLRQETYRISTAGGNCCEKYLAATAGGRLLELGGHVPYYSDDDGVTWSAVNPPAPLVNGEGAISPTPDGDVGAVYRTLRALERAGLTRSGWATSPTGPARRVYRLTPAGREALYTWGVALSATYETLGEYLTRLTSLTGHDACRVPSP